MYDVIPPSLYDTQDISATLITTLFVYYYYVVIVYTRVFVSCSRFNNNSIGTVHDSGGN